MGSQEINVVITPRESMHSYFRTTKGKILQGNKSLKSFRKHLPLSSPLTRARRVSVEVDKRPRKLAAGLSSES